MVYHKSHLWDSRCLSSPEQVSHSDTDPYNSDREPLQGSEISSELAIRVLLNLMKFIMCFITVLFFIINQRTRLLRILHFMHTGDKRECITIRGQCHSLPGMSTELELYFQQPVISPGCLRVAEWLRSNSQARAGRAGETQGDTLKQNKTHTASTWASGLSLPCLTPPMSTQP